MRELVIFHALDQPRPRFDFLFDGRGIDAGAGELRIELADLFDALGDFDSTVARVASQHVLKDRARDRYRGGREIRAVAAELEFLEIGAIGAQRLAHEGDRADPPLPKQRLLDEFLVRQTGAIAALKHRFALLEQPRKPLPYEVEIHAQELRGVALYESSIFNRCPARFLSNMWCARHVTKERDVVVPSTELRTASDNGARRLIKTGRRIPSFGRSITYGKKRNLADLTYPTWLPTTETKLTQRPGCPPRLWVRPTFGLLIWRGPASPRSCSHISYIMRRPEAPIGWPNDLSPPSGLTGKRPSRSKKPSSTSCHAVPRLLKPRSSQSTSSVGVKQSCTSARLTCSRGLVMPACL